MKQYSALIKRNKLLINITYVTLKSITAEWRNLTQRTQTSYYLSHEVLEKTNLIYSREKEQYLPLGMGTGIG